MQHEGDIWSDMPTLLAAAHEMKAPLALIRQLALELEDVAENTTAERIRLTAERSLHLVESLTRVARLDDALFACEPIYLPSLYDEVAHDIEPLSRALGQSVRVVMQSRQLTVVGNRSLLRSVLLGLCDNALTHNQPHQPIVLSARSARSRVIASVRDFGPPSSQLRQIRRSIGVSAQPIRNRPRSSGLGLLIAEQFARHMNAELHLCRHRSRGATFSINLPASQQLSLLTP